MRWSEVRDIMRGWNAWMGLVFEGEENDWEVAVDEIDDEDEKEEVEEGGEIPGVI